MPFPEQIDEDDFYDDTPTCQRCNGNGTILVCPDDMCRGMGECIHGDGEVICPNCDGAFDL